MAVDMELDTDPKAQTSKKNKKKKNNLNNEGKLNVTIESVKEQPGKIPPLVGYFPSGVDPTSSNPENQPLIRVYRNQKKTRRLKLAVRPTGSKVDFVGTNYYGEAAAGRMCRFALGILDKETQKLKIVPIAANRVFRLEPRVRTSDASDKEAKTPAVAELSKEEKGQKLDILTDLYGTTTARKKAKIAAKLREKEDPGSEHEMKQILAEAAIDKGAVASTSAETARNVPPHDLSATTPEMAYPLEKIIPKGEWDYLMDILELAQAKEDIKPDVYPTFVCNRVYKLELIQDEEEKRRLAGILSYITHLVKFKDRHTIEGHSSAKHHKLPSMLFQKFRKMFVDDEKKRLSDEKVGLLISYVLVLTLYIDEFQSDMVDIAKDLKMSVGSLRHYFEHLGCQFKRKNYVTIATLPVPLQFPTLRKRRRGG